MVTEIEVSSKDTHKSRLEDLTISNNFLFVNVMKDKEIAMGISSIILNEKIDDIEVLDVEKVIDRYILLSQLD